jgi:hypothetical protein
MEIIIAAIIGAFSTIATVYLKIFLNEQSEHTKLKKHTEQNDDVYKALEYTKEKLESDRVVVYEFHNGDVYYSGGSQQKFSNTYEVLAHGISSELKNQQNLRVSSFNRFIKPLIDEDDYGFWDINQVEDIITKTFFEDQGTKSTYCVPIKLLSGKIIGILGVDYVKEPKKLTNTQKAFVKNQSCIISGYLKT